MKKNPIQYRMEDIEFNALLKKAEKQIAAFDKIEGCPITNYSQEGYLGTILEALHAGIRLHDWDNVAEACVMLKQGINKCLGTKERNN